MTKATVEVTRESALEHALKLGLEYWAHRQQRYKNRHPAWVQAAHDALALSRPEPASDVREMVEHDMPEKPEHQFWAYALGLLRAQQRMLNRWSEGDAAVRQRLWRDLHTAGDALLTRSLQAPGAVERGGVYVASRASLPERSAMWRRFRDDGVPITSSWIDEAGEGETGCFAKLWDRIFSEIAAADHLVLYAEPDDFPLKGALIEAGIALGMDKPVTVCLPGVEVQGRTHRPIGSWIEHRLVTRNDDIATALSQADQGEGGK